MLELKNITKYYGKIKGCEDISFKVNKGEIVGFIGPNGSGKSTTIKCIMNSLNKNKGEVLINNKLIDNNDCLYKTNIGYLPGEVHLYDNLTAKEMIEYNNSFYHKSYLENALKISKTLDLDLNKRIKELSLGNLKKLGIVLSLMHEPELIILDEPTNGLDPLIQEKFFAILKEYKSKGSAILFSTHILSDVRKVCDKVVLIKNGNIIEKLDIKEEHTLEIIIKSKEVKEIKEKLNKYDLTINKDTITFNYNDDINKLINILNKYKLDNLIIEKKLLEDKLMSYYKEEE